MRLHEFADLLETICLIFFFNTKKKVLLWIDFPQKLTAGISESMVAISDVFGDKFQEFWFEDL